VVAAPPAGFALGISYAMNYFWLDRVRGLVRQAVHHPLRRHERPQAGDPLLSWAWCSATTPSARSGSLLGLALGVPTYKIYI
jgi:hypothetical protein